MPDRRDWRVSFGRAAVPAVLAVGVFGVCYGLARALSRAGVFAYVDVLFDADSAWFLKGFSEGLGTGTGWGARSLVHPNVANLVNPPLRLLADACSGVGLCAAAPDVARQQIALMVSPAAAAIETVFVFLAVRVVYQSELRAVLAALLGAALLPTLVFGATPESFALTGCAFAALFYLASRTAAGQPVHGRWWAVVGVALASITLTNVWLFALGYAVVHSQPRWLTLKASLDALRVSVIVLIATGALALAIGSAYGALRDYRTDLQQLAEIRTPKDDLADRRWFQAIADGAGVAVSRSVTAVPRAFGDTVLPPRPSIHGTALGLDVTSGSLGVRPEPSLHANFRNAAADWGTGVALAALAGAIVLAFGSRGRSQIVYRLAIVLIAGNWAFHSIFGIELFLYSKHWSVAVAVMLAAWFEARRLNWYAGAAVVVILLILASVRDVLALGHLFRALGGT